jgi:hypothetical protein
MFEKEITKQRIVEAIEEIESDVQAAGRGDKDAAYAAERKLRELRLALESKPLLDSVQ